MSVSAMDFMYDGILLSEKGYIICQFSGINDQISNGAEITFAEVPLQHGIKRTISGISYETVITTTFCICKSVCDMWSQGDYLSVEDVRDLARWLQRKEYLPFQLYSNGYENITYYGSFTINQVRAGTNIIGLELTLTTNSPFGWDMERSYTYNNTTSLSILNTSDEVGTLYPKFIITCLSSGDLTISNNMTPDESTVIKNCSANESIAIYHPIITSGDTSHDIANDFNYIYPKVINTFDEKRNTYTLSMPCNVTISYRPLAKIGV